MASPKNAVFSSKTQAADQGEQGFALGFAVLDCLRTACEAPTMPDQASIAGTLEVALLHLALARRAFQHLSDNAGGGG
jgi:hypothetical protein